MENLKNYFINQDITEIKKSLKLKIFDYFYRILSGKNVTSFFILYFFHSVEMLQLISFAFSSPHTGVWKMPEKTTNFLDDFLSGFRLAPILKYANLQIFTILTMIIFIFVLIFFILLMVQISIGKENSSFFERLRNFTQFSMPFFTILLYIPFNELFFSMFNCRNKCLHDRKEEVHCWKGTHLILVLVSIVGIILLAIINSLFTYFYFYPFSTQKVTIKLTASVDILLLLFKIIFIIQHILIKNEYISIAFLLICSIFLVHAQDKESVYNKKKFELFLNLRNVFVFWTFFILLIAKICYKSKIKAIIYILVSGYPLIAFSFIMYFNEKYNKFNYNHTSINNVNDCINQLRLLLRLIDSFLGENKSNLNNNESHNQKNDLILKGIIKMHTTNCLREDCLLTKFIKNKGNYNVQKQCLLNYMALFFITSIKKFPNNILLRMQFIQFNYDKKYNLNSIKTTFEEIKKMEFNLSSEFILYCQEKEISKIRIRGVDDGNDEEKEKLLLDQNYKKLKNLIANSTKLYVEFWGIFAANITNNLNTQKLYKLGEKLNTYLKEINHLWEKNLKNKKIDADNENNAQLLCRFLREILWDQNRSDAVQKKINEEHNMQSYNRAAEDDKNQLDNIDNLETQDYYIYINTNEKGKTNILQYSNSLTYLIGYQKYELINKPLEVLLPQILIESNSKLLEEYLRIFTAQKSSEKEESFQSLDRQKAFVLIKSKMGYIIPFNSRYTFFDNNDFSNNFLIKAKYESRDVKSMYAYYLLTKPDFTLENISSSAIHLGLSLDLLKKYVIRLNVLIRTGNDDTLNLFEKYKEYKDEAKKITWVEPEFIYPKDDMMKVKDIPVQDLIKKSKKIKLFLQIIEMTDHKNEIIGFVFKLFEKKKTKNKKNNELEQLIPKTKNELLFDLLTLNYIRIKIVKEKSGFRNLRENDNDIENENNLILSKSSNKGRLKTRDSNILDELSEEEKEQIVITKDKIFELQSKDSSGIKSFINLLPFYGSEISLIKHRPNRELYPTGKAQEPQIKIDLSKYVKIIESQLKEIPKLLKRIKNMQKEQKSSNEENIPIKQNYISEEIKPVENKNINVEDINRDFTGNANVSLINIINISSIRLVKVVDFFIYFFVISILTVHFILTYDFFQKNSKRYKYFNYSYQLLNDVVYIKYFVSEGFYLTDVPNYYFLNKINETTYLSRIKTRISELGDDLADILYQFNYPKIAMPEEYTKYISNANLTIKTNNEMSKTEQQPYSSAVNILTTAIFSICKSDTNIFKMDNNLAYELMVNLIDSYYLSFEKIIIIMIEFFQERTKDIRLTNLIIFAISFAISAIYLILFYRMMVKLDKDREKPLNLFLTIKNKIFEDLKNSSENFSNKLLNKLFRADENEEESQQNFSKINIKPNDINIAKFKALNEYKSLNKKENSFISYFIQLAVFYGLINIIILLEYLNTISFCNKVHNYIDIYNSTYFSEIYLVTRVNIIKQYFYNCSITNYGFTEEAAIYNFLYAFLFISQEIEPTIKETSKTHSFLEDEYKPLFQKYFFTNYTDLINGELIGINATDLYANLSSYMQYGFNSVNYKIFEMLKYLSIKYFMNSERTLNKNISQLINHPMWFEMHKLLVGIVREWYKNIDDLLSSYYNDYIDTKLNSYIFLFIVLIIVISLYYWIAWKKYEGEFIDSIQKSFDLINLIPEEIKNIIINKLNEN